MKCPVCKSYVEPKLDIRSVISIIAFTLLVGFFGGVLFTDWKLIPKFERKIEQNTVLQEELKKGYVPPRKGG